MTFYSVVKRCIETDQTIALYRLPKGTQTFLIIDTSKGREISIDELDENIEGFIFHPYKVSLNCPVYFIKSTYIISSDCKDIPLKLQEYLQTLEPVKRQEKVEDLDISKDDYIHTLNKLIKKLREKKLEKVVYSRTKTIEGKGLGDVITTFQKLEEKNKDAFVFFVNIANKISWIGASPELLLSSEKSISNLAVNEQMKTVALAGTQRFINDVVWGEKDIEEQRYVQKYIEYRLDFLQLEYKKGDIQTSRAGDICHIKTEYVIDGNLNRYWQLLEKLHPTPAVCGLACESAKKEIDEIEKHERVYYSGFLGVSNINKKTAMYVNLRSARVYNDAIKLYIGSGITSHSDAENEWNETEMKGQTLEKEL